MTQSKYDLAGRRWLQVDADNHATAFVHDGLGRLTWVITDVNPGAASLPSPLPANWPAWDQRLADSTATQYRYDEVGNLIAQSDANNRITAYEYDALGRRLKREEAGGPDAA